MRVDAARDKRAGVALAGRFRAAWKMTRLAGASCRWGYGFRYHGHRYVFACSTFASHACGGVGWKREGKNEPHDPTFERTRRARHRGIHAHRAHRRRGGADDRRPERHHRQPEAHHRVRPRRASSPRSIPSATCPTSCARTRCAAASPRKWRLENAPKQARRQLPHPVHLGRRGRSLMARDLRRNGHSRDSDRSRRQGVLGRARWPRPPSRASRAADGAAHAFLETTEELGARRRRPASTQPSPRGASPRCGPLAGVPVGYKDNLNLTGTHTTCSSNMLARLRVALHGHLRGEHPARRRHSASAS